MDIKLKDGDILSQPNGYYTYISGIEDALQKVSLAVKIPKGSFIYNKELGSGLYSINAEDSLAVEKAQILLDEALMNTDIKAVVSAVEAKADGGVKFSIQVNFAGETNKTEVMLFADV